MTHPCLLAVTSRTVSILLDPTAQYVLSEPIPWSLHNGEGQQVRSGQTTATVMFLEGLEPAASYVLVSELGDVPFRTQACAGLINCADFGADPALRDNSEALTAAITAVPEGGTLRIAGGRFQTLPIFLKPHMTLLIEDGAEIAAISDRSRWPQLPAYDENGRVIGTWEGLPRPSFAAVITAINCDGLAITGGGIIDGGGNRGDWWDWPKETRDGARRPRTLHLAHSNDVTVTGVTVRNSPSWTVHPYRCRDLHISALRIENPADSPNTDGLNPESCSGVDICGVAFSVGDDCIAIKAGKRGAGDNSHLAPCTDLKISHCLMQFGHGAVVLGSEMSGDIRNVTIKNCVFQQTDRGLRLKTRRGRGGVIENVIMENIDMADVPTPIAVNAFYFCDADGKDDWVQSRAARPVDETTPRITGITVRNVRADAVALAAAAVLGLPEAPVLALTFENFTVSYDPAAQPDVPLMALGVAPVRHGGIISEFCEVMGQVKEHTRQESRPAC